MNLLRPDDASALLRNRIAANGEAGAAWVRSPPRLVASAVDRWSLTLEPHYANLSYNYVAPVTRDDGALAVLKLCFLDPEGEFTHELSALDACAGRGCVSLLDSDPDLGALLLERIEPASNLTTLQDDIKEVSTAAVVMSQLWRRPEGDHTFPSIADWLEGVAIDARKSLQHHDWLDAGIALGRDLLAGPSGQEMLLHGDLHHWNILLSRRGWLAIDPKGVIGEPAWETGAFLYNNLHDHAKEATWRTTIRRRADQFADALDLDRRRVHACAAVYTAISLAWDLESLDRRSEWSAKHRAVMQELAGF